MADYIHQLQRTKKKPTAREEEILEELSYNTTQEQKLSKWKTALILTSINLGLHVPFIKELFKKGIPILNQSDYYYALFTSILIFVISFIIIQL